MKTVSLTAANSTNATSASAVAGRLKKVQLRNTGAVACYFKIYDKASAPTVGTDVPVMLLTVPANAELDISIKGDGLPFALGLAYATTLNKVNSDSTAVAAGALKADLAYYS